MKVINKIKEFYYSHPAGTLAIIILVLAFVMAYIMIK